MTNYELYEKVIEASKMEDEGAFNAAARNWIEGSESVNFEDLEANELFAAAKYHCAAWRNKAINGRVGKLRMIECVRKIIEKDLENPYPFEETKEEPVEETKEEAKEEVTKIEPKITHVFGVVPEEKQIEPIKEEEQAEVHADKKGRLFGKNKR